MEVMLEQLFLALFEKGTQFSAQPREIQALRRALGWSRQELGYYLGLYLNRRDCYTIYRWEKGISRPRKALKAKMLGLVMKVQGRYLGALREAA